MPSIATSMNVSGNSNAREWSSGSGVPRSTSSRPWPMPRSKNTSSDNGKPTTGAIKSLPACERYCREQCELLRAMEDLAKQERQMHELDNRKDQIMTVCKVALANLGMWVRDHYFPAEYAHASWHRLQVFFQLPGRIHWGSGSHATARSCASRQGRLAP